MDLKDRLAAAIARPAGAAAASVLAVGLAAAPASAAEPFDAIVVFGDSLSDIGNAGRYSNGPVWVEQLAAELGLSIEPSERGGWNLAIGGARLDPDSGPTSLRAQAVRYMARPKPAGRILHVVFGGGNDVLGAVSDPAADQIVQRAAAALKSIVADLAGQRATDILVPNLPDIGMTPAMRSRGERAVAEARVLTERFNAAVDRALSELGDRHQVRVHRLDLYAMAERARQDPGAFGFADAATPCQALPSCEGFIFWDDVHPTTTAHRRLAEAAFTLVAAGDPQQQAASGAVPGQR